MESSESHEPSYYEVALTNRQVLIAFVVLLTSIVAAFLSGVWIGRGGNAGARPAAVVAQAANTPAEPPLEQLSFFSNKEPGARSGTASTTSAPAAPTAPVAPSATPLERRDPAPTAPAESDAAEDRATEEMRRNLDATMAANRTSPPAESAPAGTRSTAKPAAAATTPSPKPAGAATTQGTKPAVAAATPSTKPAATGKIFVQVYSSTNAARAKEIVAQLRKAGFTVVVAETAKGNGTNHRVRVGPYAERSKADAAAVKLRRDFRLETWVTDSP